MRIPYARPSLVVVALAAALGGCAANPPPPTAQMALARAAVSDAQSAGGADLAPAEYRNAQDKLNRAAAAMGAEDNTLARQLAEQAEADARLAETKARNAKAQRAVAELRQGIQDLRREIERQPVVTPLPGDTR